jgi:hypothetical protein
MCGLTRGSHFAVLPDNKLTDALGSAVQLPQPQPHSALDSATLVEHAMEPIDDRPPYRAMHFAVEID